MKRLWLVAVSVVLLNAVGCCCMRKSPPVAAAPVCAPVCTPATCDPCAQGVTYGMPALSY